MLIFQHQIVHLAQLDHWAKYSQYQLYQFYLQIEQNILFPYMYLVLFRYD